MCPCETYQLSRALTTSATHPAQPCGGDQRTVQATTIAAPRIAASTSHGADMLAAPPVQPGPHHDEHQDGRQSIPAEHGRDLATYHGHQAHQLDRA